MRRMSSKSRASPGAAPGRPFGRSVPTRDAAGKLTGTTRSLADGRFRILSPRVATGESSRTVLAQLVAQAIGLDVDDVVVAEADPHLVPDSSDPASATVRGLGRLRVDAARRLENAPERRAGRPLDLRDAAGLRAIDVPFPVPTAPAEAR